MGDVRKYHTAGFKVKVVLEALKGTMTMAEISAQYGLHSVQISRWKKEALEILSQGFSTKRSKSDQKHDELVEELYKQIGQLKVELDWLKKKSQLLRR